MQAGCARTPKMPIMTSAPAAGPISWLPNGTAIWPDGGPAKRPTISSPTSGFIRRFQGRGIGTALLDEIESAIRQRGYSAARLDSHARNLGAIQLYKRQGYRVKAYYVTYSEPLDEDIDKVEMIKEFSPGGEQAPDEDGLYSP